MLCDLARRDRRHARIRRTSASCAESRRTRSSSSRSRCADETASGGEALAAAPTGKPFSVQRSCGCGGDEEAAAEAAGTVRGAAVAVVRCGDDDDGDAPLEAIDPPEYGAPARLDEYEVLGFNGGGGSRGAAWLALDELFGAFGSFHRLNRLLMLPAAECIAAARRGFERSGKAQRR